MKRFAAALPFTSRLRELRLRELVRLRTLVRLRELVRFLRRRRDGIDGADAERERPASTS